MESALPRAGDSSRVLDFLRAEEARQPLSGLTYLRCNLLCFWSARFCVDRTYDQHFLLLVDCSVDSSDEPVPPDDRQHVGAELSFLLRQELLQDVFEPEQALQPPAAEDVVEGRHK